MIATIGAGLSNLISPFTRKIGNWMGLNGREEVADAMPGNRAVAIEERAVHAGIQEMNTWGGFLRGHIRGSLSISGISCIATGVLLHYTHTNICQNSKTLTCFVIEETTIFLYTSGVICVAALRVFMLIAEIRNQVPMLAQQPVLPQLAPVNINAAAIADLLM